MTSKSKTVKTTVGDLIAAVMDVVGDQVDLAVELIRFDDLRKMTLVEIDGARKQRR